ncbi:MAG TPA: hypothetical protein VFQ71_14705 [Gaiellales bacterium]|jgi:hypothetical protein|nr:hypothetical protein [Gaiellales bacterium]
MSTVTQSRVQGGVRSRLQCWREGHYWERQVAEEGDHAHQVCVRCGKVGEELPVLDGEPTTVIERDPDVVAAEAAPEAVQDEEPVEDEFADEPATGPRIDTRTAVIVVATAVVVGGAIFALRRRRRR